MSTTWRGHLRVPTLGWCSVDRSTRRDLTQPPVRSASPSACTHNIPASTPVPIQGIVPASIIDPMDSKHGVESHSDEA